jgi:hypothetical protein
MKKFVLLAVLMVCFGAVPSFAKEDDYNSASLIERLLGAAEDVIQETALGDRRPDNRGPDDRRPDDRRKEIRPDERRFDGNRNDNRNNNRRLNDERRDDRRSGGRRNRSCDTGVGLSGMLLLPAALMISGRRKVKP